jgi:hypothetical protein
MKFIFTIALLMAIAGLAVGQTREEVETKVRTDLDQFLSRILEPHQYALQTLVQVDTVRERQLVEGEQITQPPQKAGVEVPPLPGFDPTPQQPAETNVAQLRQVFRSADKTVLRSVAVNLTLDSTIEDEVAQQVESSVRSYLSSGYSGLSSLKINRMLLRKPSLSSQLGFGLKDWVWYLGLGLFALFMYFILRRSRGFGEDPYRANYRVLNREQKESLDLARSVNEDSEAPLLNARSAIPALPVAEDRRQSAFEGVQPINLTPINERRFLILFCRRRRCFDCTSNVSSQLPALKFARLSTARRSTR